jgi:hypothetical protein
LTKSVGKRDKLQAKEYELVQQITGYLFLKRHENFVWRYEFPSTEPSS